ncbi:MAG: ComEA family DNA-binding protein [Enterobacteriaceae bacterium]|nr:ComEA family DNA-binding protein [Enterobacteriaceae bacterium]
MKNLRTLFNLFILTVGLSIPLSHAIAAGEPVNKVALEQSSDLNKPKAEKNESKNQGEMEKGEQISGKTISEKGGININTANAEQLAKELNGVGAKKAQAIIEYREKYGPFTAIEQLQEVQGIGPAFIEKNRNKLAIN